MNVGRVWLLLLIAVAALECACIGKQPMQQGAWSIQDGFKTKVTDQAGFSPQHPES